MNLCGPLDRATVQGIVDAWTKRLLLVFPDQHISDAEHVAESSAPSRS